MTPEDPDRRPRRVQREAKRWRNRAAFHLERIHGTADLFDGIKLACSYVMAVGKHSPPERQERLLLALVEAASDGSPHDDDDD